MTYERASVHPSRYSASEPVAHAVCGWLWLATGDVFTAVPLEELFVGQTSSAGYHDLQVEISQNRTHAVVRSDRLALEIAGLAYYDAAAGCQHSCVLRIILDNARLWDDPKYKAIAEKLRSR